MAKSSSQPIRSKFFLLSFQSCNLLTFVLNRVQILVEGTKRKLLFKEIRINDAGKYTCHTNADETESEVTVDCK